jgi:serine/threonine-protein kinase
VSDDPLIPPVDPLIGTRVGEYEILEPVGEGGMGVVYRGIQPVIKKRVAIKVLKPQVAGDEQQVRRLVIEAESVNAIGHRGIIDIFGLGALPDGRPYVIMEFLEGEPLDQWIARQPGGRVPLLTSLELLLEICAPLGAAHRANVIHRDLKPSNVFLCLQADGTRFLKILDFGLAKRAVGLDGNTKQTSQSTVSGTPDYMAPEQARGLDISPRSDLYALGVIAFELFTGRVPFTGATPMDVMVAHVGTAAPDPRTLEPSLPFELSQLVLRLLSKKPEERPQTVDEVRTALEDIVVLLGNPRPRSSRELPALDPRTLEPVRPQTPQPAMPVAPTPLPLPPVPPRGQRAVMMLLIAIIGVLGTGALWLATRPVPVVERAPAQQPAPVVVPPHVALVDPPDLVDLQEDAGTEVLAVLVPIVEDAGVAIEDAGVKVAGKIAVKRETPPPTTRQLKDRIAKLNARATSKKDLDPTALQFLGRYSIEATAADSPARRAKLDRALSDWERNFLRK